MFVVDVNELSDLIFGKGLLVSSIFSVVRLLLVESDGQENKSLFSLVTISVSISDSEVGEGVELVDSNNLSLDELGELENGWDGVTGSLDGN